jgi:hypothetical protein
MYRQDIYRLISILSATALFSFPPALAKSEALQPVVESIVVDEPQDLTFRAICCLRSVDKNRTLESYTAPQAIISEHFGGLPIVGDSVRKYAETESAPNRIDYRMISSNRFKTFKGAWILTPESGKSTKVTLTSFLDPGVRVPFWRQISRAATIHMVRNRLSELETEAHRLAEEEQVKHNSDLNISSQ